MNTVLTETPKKMASYDFCTYEKDVDRKFVNQFVADAIEVLAIYRGGHLYICGYNPPWIGQPSIKGVAYQPGHISLTFSKTAEVVDEEFLDLDLIFGFYENGEFIRTGVNKDDLRNRPGCCECVVYNFDEAWQIICLLGEKLEISEIRISCGGA